MANRAAAALVLREGDRSRLVSLTRSSSVRAGVAQRARIVLLAADGVANSAVAERLGTTRQTVVKWRDRYQRSGVAGLDDQPRAGRPRKVDHRSIVATTLRPPPERLGVTHWSSRLLAAHLGVGNATVARAWRNAGVHPQGAWTFRFSTDPGLVARITGVAGLRLAPPANAIVLREGSRTAELGVLPTRRGRAEQPTDHSVRRGTAALIAALQRASGTHARRLHQDEELLAFLEQVVRGSPDDGSGRKLHLVVDNPTAHEDAGIRDWLAANPHVQLHVTHTPRFWLDLVEVWLGLIEHQAARRGTRSLVEALGTMLRAFAAERDDHRQAFVWVSTPEETLQAPTVPRLQKRSPGEMEPVSIRTVADGFGIPFSTLHYWERQGLVTPRRQGRQRFYDLGQIRRIALVQLWRETGMLTIDDIATVLTPHGTTSDWRRTVRDRIGAVSEQIDRLGAAQAYLSHLLTCPHEPLEACPDFQEMVSTRVETWYGTAPAQ